MDLDDVVDTEEKLKHLSRDACLALSIRDALRRLPELVQAEKPKSNGAFSFSFIGIHSETLYLFNFRSLLTAASSLVLKDVEFSEIAPSCLKSEQMHHPVSSPARFVVQQISSGTPSENTWHLASSALTSKTNHTSDWSDGREGKRRRQLAILKDIKVIANSQSVSMKGLLTEVVWFEHLRPTEPAKLFNQFILMMDQNLATWRFWKDWYLQMYNEGTPDWDLCREVALIPDDIWDDGPEAVAREIERIEKARQPLDNAAAQAQAASLTQQRAKARDCAMGLSSLVATALDAYRLEVCNSLPESFEPLQNLPGIMTAIAATMDDAEFGNETEEKLAILLQLAAKTITSLNNRLILARQEALATPSGPDKFQLLHEGFYTRMGERGAELITSPILWGGLATGLGFLLGPESERLLSTLQDCVMTVVQPETPELWRLPPAPDLEHLASMVDETS